MKMMLSIPRTISSAVSVSRLAQACGSVNSSSIQAPSYSARGQIGQVGWRYVRAASIDRRKASSMPRRTTGGGPSTRRPFRLEFVHACIAAGQPELRQTFLQIIRQNRSEEHTSELQSLMRISYAVFCLKKKKERKKISLHKTK